MAYNNAHFSPHEEAILTSIIYSDIFDFPLTRDELWKFLITEKKITKNNFEKALEDLKEKYIYEKDGYFSLKTNRKIIERRKRNSEEVSKKLEIAERAAFYISHIPSVLFVGISGGLAMGDVEEDDDIDFFIITKRNTIFKSRLLILFVLQLLNLRRKRQEIDSKDKVCVNYLIDELNISFSKAKHDVYTAHEILQIKPLHNVDEIYQIFLTVNKWIKNYLPNAGGSFEKITIHTKKFIHIKLFFYIIDKMLSEKLCRFIQILLINKHIKNEIVTNHVLAFNPNDYRVQTLTKLRLKMRELGLLTKL
ncbi:MAG TPA: hypothetical protein VM077_05400 [Candidatus Limnocylindrales bacterium]|nr:hypothetical protein [Candidatus Limnocylindrales bacterium]